MSIKTEMIIHVIIIIIKIKCVFFIIIITIRIIKI